MSVLVYRDKSIAGAAAATLLAAQVIEKPMSVLGLDYSEDIAPVYRALARMTADGLLDWSDITAFALSEHVRADGAQSIASRMQTLFYEHVNLDAGRRFTPDAEAADWSVACTDYEDGILRAGGIDLTFLAVGPDGSIAYNVGAPELAPVTHVERTQDGRVVTVGLGTVMGAPGGRRQGRHGRADSERASDPAGARDVSAAACQRRVPAGRGGCGAAVTGYADF